MNDVPLKEYLDASIKDIRESIKVAYASMEKRLDGMNEFRDTLKDQAGKFVTREELDARLETVNKNRKDNTTLILSLVGIAIAILGLISRFVK